MATQTQTPRRNKFGLVDFETVEEAMTSLVAAVREHVKRWPDKQDDMLQGALLCLASDVWRAPTLAESRLVFDAGLQDDLQDDIARLLPEDDSE